MEAPEEELVEYVEAQREDFEYHCEELLDKIGREYVVRKIVTPCSYIHPTSEQPRGVTLLLQPDTPVKRCYLHPTLSTGTAEYDLSVMEDGSAITKEKLLEARLPFDMCVPEVCEAEDKFQLLQSRPQDWSPSMGVDCVNDIYVACQWKPGTSQWSWKLMVTAGLDYAAAELVEYAEQQEWTLEQLYRSAEYAKLCKAAVYNRDRIAYAAAVAAGLRLPPASCERRFTESQVWGCQSRTYALHHTLVMKQLQNESGDLVCAVHIDTFPLHDFHRIHVRASPNLVCIYEPMGAEGRQSWCNPHANSYPANSGLRSYSELSHYMSSWKPAPGETSCSGPVVWQSRINYNLYALPGAYKPWDQLQHKLTRLGRSAHWKETQMSIVLIKMPSMDVRRLTAWELLKTAQAGKVRVPIKSQVFMGDGENGSYSGLWAVYREDDEPASVVVQDSPYPGYVDLGEVYVRRIAHANGELPHLYDAPPTPQPVASMDEGAEEDGDLFPDI